jgi:hypothetical protein
MLNSAATVHRSNGIPMGHGPWERSAGPLIYSLRNGGGGCAV